MSCRTEPPARALRWCSFSFRGPAFDDLSHFRTVAEVLNQLEARPALAPDRALLDFPGCNNQVAGDDEAAFVAKVCMQVRDRGADLFGPEIAVIENVAGADGVDAINQPLMSGQAIELKCRDRRFGTGQRVDQRDSRVELHPLPQPRHP